MSGDNLLYYPYDNIKIGAWQQVRQRDERQNSGICATLYKGCGGDYTCEGRREFEQRGR
jgi:hypothetical protein